MNKFLYPIIVFTLCYVSSVAQQKPIQGLMGVKFGATKAIVSAVAKQRGGVILPASSKDDFLSYSELKFGNRTPFIVSFGFVNNKLYEARVFYKVENAPKVLDLYSELQNEISGIYGESSQNEREYKYPFKEGDPEAWLAVQGGYTTISDLWKDGKGGDIKLYIMAKGELISLWYQNEDLYKEAQKQKSAKSSDY